MGNSDFATVELDEGVCCGASSRLSETEMTSDIGVERAVQEQFLFHCHCGATVEINGKKGTCSDCGATVEAISCKSTPEGNKYRLRINKHPWKTEPLLWPLVLQPMAATHPTRQPHKEPDYNIPFRSRAITHSALHHLESPDYNKRCLRLGLLILLAPFYLPLFLLFFLSVAHVRPEQGRANEQIVETPEPTDCDWFSESWGDKGCHYERRAIHINGKRGGYVSVEWARVDD